jgi:hypothetical protein
VRDHGVNTIQHSLRSPSVNQLDFELKIRNSIKQTRQHTRSLEMLCAPSVYKRGTGSSPSAAPLWWLAAAPREASSTARRTAACARRRHTPRTWHRRESCSGLAKRPREQSPTRNPLGVTSQDSQLFHRYAVPALPCDGCYRADTGTHFGVHVPTPSLAPKCAAVVIGVAHDAAHSHPVEETHYVTPNEHVVPTRHHHHEGDELQHLPDLCVIPDQVKKHLQWPVCRYQAQGVQFIGAVRGGKATPCSGGYTRSGSAAQGEEGCLTSAQASSNCEGGWGRGESWGERGEARGRLCFKISARS